MVQGPTRDHPSQNHTEDRSSVSLEHPAEQPSASRVLDMQQNETTPSVTFGDSSLGEGAKSEDSLPPEGASNEESPNSLPPEGGGAGFAAGDAATEGVEKQLPQSRHRQSTECLDSSLGEGASNEESPNSLPPEGASNKETPPRKAPKNRRARRDARRQRRIAKAEAKRRRRAEKEAARLEKRREKRRLACERRRRADPPHMGRAPKRTDAVDRYGNHAGSVRRHAWFDRDGNLRGTFVREKDSVFLELGGERVGYLDKYRNVRTLSSEYIASLRPFFARLPIFFFLFAVIFLWLLSAGLTLRFSPFAERVGLDLPDNYSFVDGSAENGKWSFIIENPVHFVDGDGEALDYVYPGDTGVFTFTASNFVEMPVVCSFAFLEDNDADIEMRYMLTMDGEYLTPEEYTDHEDFELGSISLKPGKTAEFTLYWKWVDDDEKDTNFTQQGGEYQMNIELIGEVAASAS